MYICSVLYAYKVESSGIAKTKIANKSTQNNFPHLLVKSDTQNLRLFKYITLIQRESYS